MSLDELVIARRTRDLEVAAEAVLQYAADLGLHLRIETEYLQPLAMRNVRPRVVIWPMRGEPPGPPVLIGVAVPPPPPAPHEGATGQKGAPDA